ncbi:MAG TPA: hypothetical protein VJJ26_04675 [Candidatus Babeliales bacterium]|nr:hypothetical protein [Candidatus Babeliales bacterium]
MSFFKNLLPIILLCTISSVSPRGVGQTRPVEQPKPTPIKAIPTPPIIRQQPVIQQKSYAQALDIIKNQMPSRKVLINNVFTQEFIDFVTALNLSEIETTALLQAGANIHATWTDNNETNKKILSSLRNNIKSITQTKPREQIKPTPQPQPAKKDRSRKQPQPTPPAKPIIQPKPIVPQKPVAQPRPIQKSEPIQQDIPMQEHLTTNNLVMTLDPEKAETVQNLASGAMVSQAIATLYEKAAPIIMTSNVLEIILRIKHIVGDINLTRIRHKDLQNQ